MSKILSIDASTEACSVALLNGKEATDSYELAPRQHAKRLLPMIEDLLSKSQIGLNQLDAIACNVGPGAFTGIRIAVSVAQGLAYGAGLPTISLSSLANLAALGYAKTMTNNKPKTDWLCAIDARMSEVYFAAYKIEAGLPVLIETEMVIAPESIDFSLYQSEFSFEQMGLIGNAWPEYSEALYNGVITDDLLLPDCLPSAIHSLKQAEEMLQTGKVLSPELLQPTYLRNNVAIKKLVKN